MANSTNVRAEFDPRQRYSVIEALSLLRTSRRSFYRLMREGQIRIIKEGRRTYVAGAEIARLSQ